MAKIDEELGSKFVCPKCKNRGGNAERLAMSGTGLSRFMDIQPFHYVFVSCRNCGFTEIYNLKTLEGKDDLGALFDILFSG